MYLEKQFDPSFFKEEIRCGYTVTEKLKKVWAVEMDLLSQILKICQKYDIRVYAFAGTMLGAVRHQGFIPWDDDLDVCMLREDYDRFVRVAEAELKEPYFLQTPLSDRRFFCGYARLRNSSTTGIIKWNKSSDYNGGIYVDIHALDGYTENTIKLYLQLIKKGIVVRMINAYLSVYDKAEKKRHYFVRAAGFLIHRFFSYEKLVLWYEKSIQANNRHTDRVSLMTHYKWFIYKYWCYREDLKEIIWMPFEDMEVPVAANYDRILKNLYGDYHKFPPAEERGTWHNDSIIFDPEVPYKEYFRIHKI